MRKLAILALIAVIFSNCSKDKVTNNPVPSVTVLPNRALVDYDSTIWFTTSIYGTSDSTVKWLANYKIGGDSIYGRIDTLGNYRAPGSQPIGSDSVIITARLVSDSTIKGNAWVIFIDPSKIYVSATGSDVNGSGSIGRPYRTITKALYRARLGHTVIVGAGEYNSAAGEIFPLRISSGITLQGAGEDSSFITGLGGMNPLTDAALEVDGDAIIVENFHIRSANSLGVGMWIRPGRQTSIEHNKITNNFIGIYLNGAAMRRPILYMNTLSNDSIGIVTADSCIPVIRNCTITACRKIGLEIRDFSAPDLGVNDSTNAGHNTINNCGDNQFHWLIYNGTPNTIWAIGNTWQLPIPQYNDPYIYDDEEPGSTSGQVKLMP